MQRLELGFQGVEVVARSVGVLSGDDHPRLSAIAVKIGPPPHRARIIAIRPLPQRLVDRWVDDVERCRHLPAFQRERFTHGEHPSRDEPGGMAEQPRAIGRGTEPGDLDSLGSVAM